MDHNKYRKKVEKLGQDVKAFTQKETADINYNYSNLTPELQNVVPVIADKDRVPFYKFDEIITDQNADFANTTYKVEFARRFEDAQNIFDAWLHKISMMQHAYIVKKEDKSSEESVSLAYIEQNEKLQGILHITQELYEEGTDNAMDIIYTPEEIQSRKQQRAIVMYANVAVPATVDALVYNCNHICGNLKTNVLGSVDKYNNKLGDILKGAKEKKNQVSKYVKENMSDKLNDGKEKLADTNDEVKKGVDEIGHELIQEVHNIFSRAKQEIKLNFLVADKQLKQSRDKFQKSLAENKDQSEH